VLTVFIYVPESRVLKTQLPSTSSFPHLIQLSHKIGGMLIMFHLQKHKVRSRIVRLCVYFHVWVRYLQPRTWHLDNEHRVHASILVQS